MGGPRQRATRRQKIFNTGVVQIHLTDGHNAERCQKHRIESKAKQMTIQRTCKGCDYFQYRCGPDTLDGHITLRGAKNTGLKAKQMMIQRMRLKESTGSTE